MSINRSNLVILKKQIVDRHGNVYDPRQEPYEPTALPEEFLTEEYVKPTSVAAKQVTSQGLAVFKSGLPDFVDIPLLNGWENFNPVYESAQYRRMPSGIIELKGLIKRIGNPAPAEILGLLPTSCSPKLLQRAFTSYSYDGSVNGAAGFFLTTLGQLLYASGGKEYFLLNAMFFAESHTALFFGDSITIGLGLPDNSKKWSTQVAQKLGMTEDNQGISGTVLQGSQPILVDNGKGRYKKAITNRFPQRVFILYGTNDMRYNAATFTAKAFEADLDLIIKDTLAAGVPGSEVVIGSPPYMNPAFYTEPSYAPCNAGSDEKVKQYRDATRRVAQKYKTRWADVYEFMRTRGGNQLMLSDGVHPNEAGHTVIAEAILSAGIA